MGANVSSARTPNPALAQMLATGDFSDLTIVCKGRNFRVHKAVVCARSPVIKAALTSEEAQTNVIVIEEYEPEDVELLVKFMYLDDYDIENRPDKATTNADGSGAKTNPNLLEERLPTTPSKMPAHLLNHIRVHAMGDHFGAKDLVALANEKLENGLRLWMLHEQNSKTNAPAGASLAATLPKLIRSAHAGTPDQGIFDILALPTAVHINTLLSDPSFKQLEPMSDFALAVLGYLGRPVEKATKPEEAAKGRFHDGNAENRGGWWAEKLEMVGSYYSS